MTSVNILLYTHKKLKDGRHPIVLQIIKGRKRKLISLGKSALPEEWNEEKSLPSKKHLYQDKLTNFIKSKLIAANSIVLDLESKNKPYTLDEVVQKLKGSGSNEYLIGYFDQVIGRLSEQGKDGNVIVYRCARNSLDSFLESKDVLLSEIDAKFLNSYEEYLIKAELKVNSISVYMRTLRALLNRAIKEGLISEDLYPFRKYKIKAESTIKRAISKEDINKLLAIQLEPFSTLDMSRDFFMFSFYNRGMSFVDLVLLKKNNIEGDRLIYTRRKTKQKFSIKVTDKSREIIQKYFDPKRDYIFPIIKNPKEEFKEYKNAVRLMNKKLEKLGEIAKIDAKLTTYVSRHSWATIAKRSGIPTAVISEGLGHETEETTQIYLDSFENKVLDDANELIIN